MTRKSRTSKIARQQQIQQRNKDRVLDVNLTDLSDLSGISWMIRASTVDELHRKGQNSRCADSDSLVVPPVKSLTLASGAFPAGTVCPTTLFPQSQPSAA